MSAIDFDSEKSPFTPSGDLEDESNLNEILMESHGVDTDDDAADEQNFASEELFDDEAAKGLDGEAEDGEEESEDDD